MSSKTCFVCLSDKPVDSFYPHSKMKDGRLNKCKDCTKAAVIANRIAKIDHYRSFDRARANLPHRVKARAEYQKTDAYKLAQAIGARKWAVANALRRKAQHAVNNAIRDGRLIKQPCFVCGSNAHAHHPAYCEPRGLPQTTDAELDLALARAEDCFDILDELQ